MMVSLVSGYITTIIVAMLIYYLAYYVKCMERFINDGADLRCVFLTTFLIMSTFVAMRTLNYALSMKTDYYGMVLFKTYPSVIFWQLLCCRLIGYKSLFTNKSLKSTIYSLSWVVFLIITLTDIFILGAKANLSEVEYDESSMLLAISGLKDFISYDRIRNYGNFACLGMHLKFAIYVIFVASCFVVDRHEKRGSAKKNLMINGAYFIILLCCERLSQDDFQFLLSVKTNEIFVAIFNGVLFDLYLGFPLICFAREASSVLSLTKSKISTWKEERIQELLIESRKQKEYTKKFKAQIGDLANILKDELMKNADYFDKLSITVRRRDDKFWRTLQYETMSRIRHKED